MIGGFPGFFLLQAWNSLFPTPGRNWKANPYSEGYFQWALNFGLTDFFLNPLIFFFLLPSALHFFRQKIWSCFLIPLYTMCCSLSGYFNNFLFIIGFQESVWCPVILVYCTEFHWDSWIIPIEKKSVAIISLDDFSAPISLSFLFFCILLLSHSSQALSIHCTPFLFLCVSMWKPCLWVQWSMKYTFYILYLSSRIST